MDGLLGFLTALVRAGIQAQHSGLDEAGMAAELDRRLLIRRQLEEQGIYTPLFDDENSP